MTTAKSSDKRKQSLYFPEELLEEIKAEAQRLDRSMSWVVQKAWRIAHKDIVSFNTFNDKAGAVGTV